MQRRRRSCQRELTPLRALGFAAVARAVAVQRKQAIERRHPERKRALVGQLEVQRVPLPLPLLVRCEDKAQAEALVQPAAPILTKEVAAAAAASATAKALQDLTVRPGENLHHVAQLHATRLVATRTPFAEGAQFGT